MSHAVQITIINPDYKHTEHGKHVKQTRRFNLGRT